jgi:hypothetical protein
VVPEEATFPQRLRLTLDDRVKQDRLADWQWRWLIARCCQGDETRRPLSLAWRWHYGDYLRRAYDQAARR